LADGEHVDEDAVLGAVERIDDRPHRVALEAGPLLPVVDVHPAVGGRTVGVVKRGGEQGGRQRWNVRRAPAARKQRQEESQEGHGPRPAGAHEVQDRSPSSSDPFPLFGRRLVCFLPRAAHPYRSIIMLTIPVALAVAFAVALAMILGVISLIIALIITGGARRVERLLVLSDVDKRDREDRAATGGRREDLD